MTTTTLPPASELFSGTRWNANPLGTPLNITFDLETTAPTVSGTGPAADWTPPTAVEQAAIFQAIANIEAVTNITFTQVASGGQINFGSDTGIDVATAAGTTNEYAADGQTALSSYISYGSYSGLTDPHYAVFVTLHELGNALGLLDAWLGGVGGGTPDSKLPAQFVSLDYTITATNWSTAHGSGMGNAFPQTLQILDIEAMQALYGVNENGFIGSTNGTTVTSIGNNHTYHFTDSTAPETVWIGANVSGANCFDFTACNNPVVVNLNQAAYSSTLNGPSYYAVDSAGTTPVGPIDNICIALGTTISVGIANNLGGTLIADSTTASADVLVGGTAGDSFTAGGGKDLFIGGGGADTAVFHDAAANYTITSLAPGVLLVADTGANATDGTVVLNGDFTNLQFADKTIAEDSSATSSTAVEAPMAVIQANLDNLESLVASGHVTSIAATDSATPTLTVTAAQVTTDADALASLSAPYALTVQFTGDASQYSVTSADGGLTVTGNGVSEHLTTVSGIQFADFTEIVAAAPGSASAPTTGNITELYSAVLAREPDVGGLTFYQNALQKNPGTSLLTFATYFLDSSEYTAAHTYAQSAAGDEQFITDSYQNLLHRTPSASEVSFYETNVLAPAVANQTPGTSVYSSAQLQAHALMLVYFSASSEFLGDVQVTAANPASAQHWLILI